jgi:hypothetical protein
VFSVEERPPTVSQTIVAANTSITTEAIKSKEGKNSDIISDLEK